MSKGYNQVPTLYLNTNIIENHFLPPARQKDISTLN